MKDLMKDSLFEEFMQEFLHITRRESISSKRNLRKRFFVANKNCIVGLFKSAFLVLTF